MDVHQALCTRMSLANPAPLHRPVLPHLRTDHLAASCLPACCLQRTALSDQQLRDEVASLQLQGHRRLLVLTGEHPKYTFDEFLKAIEVISSGGWAGAGGRGGWGWGWG